MKLPAILPLRGTFTEEVRVERGRWVLMREPGQFLIGWTWKPVNRPDKSDPLGQRNRFELNLGPFVFAAYWEPKR